MSSIFAVILSIFATTYYRCVKVGVERQELIQTPNSGALCVTALSETALSETALSESALCDVKTFATVRFSAAVDTMICALQHEADHDCKANKSFTCFL